MTGKSKKRASSRGQGTRNKGTGRSTGHRVAAAAAVTLPSILSCVFHQTRRCASLDSTGLRERTCAHAHIHTHTHTHYRSCASRNDDIFV